MKLHPDLENCISDGYFAGMVSCPFVFGMITDRKSIVLINTTYIYTKAEFENKLKSGKFIEAIDTVEVWWYLELLDTYTFTEQQIKIMLERSWKHLMDPAYHHHSVDPKWKKILETYPQSFFLSEKYLNSEKYQEDIDWFEYAISKNKSSI